MSRQIYRKKHDGRCPRLNRPVPRNSSARREAGVFFMGPRPGAYNPPAHAGARRGRGSPPHLDRPLGRLRDDRPLRVARRFARANRPGSSTGVTGRPWPPPPAHDPPARRRENFLSVFGPLLARSCCSRSGRSRSSSASRSLQWGLGSRLAARPGSHGFAGDLYMSGTTLLHARAGRRDAHDDPRPKILTVARGGDGLRASSRSSSATCRCSRRPSRGARSRSRCSTRGPARRRRRRELLRRHAVDGGADALVELLRDWERWSAELLESHISFPVLAFYRSQHDNQSWVAALTTILDACALVIARVDGRRRSAGAPDVRDGPPRRGGPVRRPRPDSPPLPKDRLPRRGARRACAPRSRSSGVPLPESRRGHERAGPAARLLRAVCARAGPVSS